MLPQSMNAVTITGPGGPEVLVPVRRPLPVPGPRELLVRVAAAGLNRHDVGQRRRGTPPPGATDIPGLEVAGEVVAAGAAVSAFRAGDRVCALVNGGGYAEYCLADERATLPWPGGIPDLAAAALPEALFTLWHNLCELCELRAGDWLLLHGATSGVGSIGIQLARELGAQVLATAGSAEKCAAALRLGARAACNYRSEDFVAMVQSATGGHGADLILDMAGGLYAERNLQALAADGRISHLTTQPEPRYSAPLELIMRKRARITGSMVRPLPIERKERIAAALRERVWPLIGTRIVPLIDTEFPLAQAGAAHARLESGEHIGKVLLRP